MSRTKVSSNCLEFYQPTHSSSGIVKGGFHPTKPTPTAHYARSHTTLAPAEGEQKDKHTTGGIPRWSPTLVLVARFSAYVWQSGRDAQFSLTYGRMCLIGHDEH
jgi:hypothetical protein